ncbi:MAG: energy transducer TonB [candidate division Zixibacteria bacterium]|nr:energy transducer TonB [Candidatus Tariuqbacter arcticus]
MKRRKDPKYDLKLQYKKVLETSLVITLLVIAVVLLAFKKFEFKRDVVQADQVTIKAEDIPITQQIKRPPPPARPSIPVESDDPDIDEDITIDDVEWDITDEPPPPPPPPEETVDFFAVEEKPVLIGGKQAIMDYINIHDLYPEMARVAGINGDVIIRFVVGPDGIPKNFTIAQEKPAELGFGEAGIEAMRNMRFKPGKQRDRYVSVSMQQVIRFKIK